MHTKVLAHGETTVEGALRGCIAGLLMTDEAGSAEILTALIRLGASDDVVWRGERGGGGGAKGACRPGAS